MTISAEAKIGQLYRSILGFIRHRRVEDGLIFALIRGIGSVLSAIASMWAARALGPQNLGVSAMVVATVAQISLLLELFPQAVLVRNLKDAKAPEEQFKFYQIIIATRIVIAFVGVLIGIGFLLSGRFGNQFNLAISMGIFMLVVRAMAPAWAFQGLEKMRTLALIEVGLPVLTIAGYGIFLRKGCGPGVDLAIQTSVALILLAISWIVLFRITGWSRLPAIKIFKGLKVNESLSILWEGRWLFLMQSMIYVYVGLESPLLGYLIGVEQAGLYRTAQSLVQSANVLLALPPMLLLPRFVEWRKHSPELLWSRQLKLATYAGIFAFGACLLIVLVVPRLHVWWFGDPYALASLPSAILLVSKMVVVVNYIFTCGVMADPKKDKSIAISLGIVSALSLSLNLALIPKWGMLTAACVNLFSEICVLITTIYLSKPKKGEIK